MEARSLEEVDLVEILGSSEIVAKVINCKLEITKEQAQALRKFFHVDTSLFIC
jgi:HTH-type transcriptional regulator / antitoxin HigA